MNAMADTPKSNSDAPASRPLRCPTCRGPVEADSETFPFCSVRCRMADLGNWLGGRYVISREVSEDDLSEESGS